MDTQTPRARPYGFTLGLVAGTVVGVALAHWLAPRAAAEVRERATDTARGLKGRVDETVEDLTRAGQDLRHRVAGAVARGAREVERYATVPAVPSTREHVSTGDTP